MARLAQRIKGIRSSTMVGVALALFLGVIVVANVPTTSRPAAVAPATQATAPITVALATLAKSEDYKGKDVCTCGFVHSVGSSPDHGLDGRRRNIIHNVFVSEVPGPAPDGQAGATAICTWIEGATPTVKEREEVCVQGEYVGPIIKRCSVVPKCP